MSWFGRATRANSASGHAGLGFASYHVVMKARLRVSRWKSASTIAVGIAVLGCGTAATSPGPSGTGSSAGTGAAGTTGRDGVGGGGTTGAAGTMGGGGTTGAAGTSGGGGVVDPTPSCLKDLWAKCPFSDTCHEDDAVSGSYCFSSGTSYTLDVSNPLCVTSDGGQIQQTLSVKTPDGAPCYTLQVRYYEPTISCGPFNGLGSWTDISFTWTDATGAVVAEAHSYFMGGSGEMSFQCSDSGYTDCLWGDALPCSPPTLPTLVPQCGGAAGPCPHPSDGGPD